MEALSVLLIKPYQPTVHCSVAPPLGILSLAAYLREYAEFPVHVRLLDMRVHKGGSSAMTAMLNEFQPDIVGISCLTYEHRAMLDIAALVKARCPELLLVVGGAHATVYYNELINLSDIDAVVIGEGEGSFLELCSRYFNKEPIEDIKGVVTKGNLVPGAAQYSPVIENLDELPMPAYDLVDLEAYARLPNMNTLLKKPPYSVLQTSRGCPYRCIYCHNIFGRRYRRRSDDAIIEEMRTLKNRYRIREIQLIDDLFPMDLAKSKRLMESIINTNLGLFLSFPNGLRADRLDVELLELIIRAGTYSAAFAIESVSTRIQKLTRKHLDVDKAKQAIEQADRLGIICKGFFMFGIPGETDEERQATIDYAVDSPLLLAGMYILNAHKGSEVYDMIHKQRGFEPKINFQQQDYYKAKAYHPNGQLLQQVRRGIYRFYTKPSRIARLARRIPKRAYLLRAFKGFLELTGGYRL